MRLKFVALAVSVGAVMVAGGARVYTLRASGDPDCPAIKDLHNPVIEFTQAPHYYTTVTLTNPNACWGFDNEPMVISLYGPNGRRAITYTAGCCPHSDVGICCNITLPPHGSWTIRLGSKVNDQGASDVRVCNVHVEPRAHRDATLWKRMPDGGAITGHGSFPPGFRPGYLAPDYMTPVPVLPDDPTWRDSCDTPSPIP